MDPIVLTIKEAGRLIGCKRTKTLSLLAQNRLEKVKIGRKTLVTVESCKRLIAESTAKGGA